MIFDHPLAVFFDYSSLTGREGATVSADDVVAGWKFLLPAFDATQHLIGTHIVDMADPEHAKCTAQYQVQLLLPIREFI
jgi:hypothetical protein